MPWNTTTMTITITNCPESGLMTMMTHGGFAGDIEHLPHEGRHMREGVDCFPMSVGCTHCMEAFMILCNSISVCGATFLRAGPRVVVCWTNPTVISSCSLVSVFIIKLSVGLFSHIFARQSGLIHSLFKANTLPKSCICSSHQCEVTDVRGAKRVSAV